MTPTSRSTSLRSRVVQSLRRRARNALSRTQTADADDPFAFMRWLTDEERQLVEQTLPNSITSPERIMANADAAAYVVRRGIPGGIVECGVWRGGSIVAMIKTLQRLGVSDREIYLFDTFSGMTEPSEADTSRHGTSARSTWERASTAGKTAWDYFFADEVFNLETTKRTVLATGYPAERVHFVEGRVEDTLPAQAPDEIALLRLDTDWYESTLHELVHLYPHLSPGGVLIIDDYGHWDGCRRAVDEYFASSAPPVLLARIDYTGRIAIKH